MKNRHFTLKRKRKKKKFYKKLIHKKLTNKRFKYRLRRKRKNGYGTGSRYKKSSYKIKDKFEIDIPEILSFDKNNLDKTLIFFNKIREVSNNKRRLFINIKNLISITPEAALVLVSELDRFCTLTNSKIGVYNFKKWNHRIKNIFYDIGMYDFLKIKLSNKEKKQIDNRNSAIKYLKFKSGKNADEGSKLEILNEIESIISEGSLNGKKTLKVGITEAILNTHHHAYPNEFINSSLYKEKKWWILGSINLDNDYMKIIIYDQGKTIPNTLDEKKYFIFDKNDAEKINIAVETSKSSTKLETRGKGLKYIKKYAQKADNGELEIISGKGYYKYTKKNNYKDSKQLKYCLQGTLIAWSGHITSSINIDETLYKD